MDLSKNLAIANLKSSSIRPNFKHVYQIYYDENSRKQCYESFNHYYNPTLSPFFENTVIRDIISSNEFSHIDDCEWVAILSPKFFRKARGFANFVNPLLLDKYLDNTDCDCVGFNSKSTQQNIIRQANHYHPFFIEVMETLLENTGIKYDIQQKTRIVSKRNGYQIRANIFSNYIFAKKWVWDKYRDYFFMPMYEAMENAEGRLKEMLWADSGYSRKHQLKDRLKEHLGVGYYPYHTFICERFWTMFLNLHPEIKVTHYGL